MPENAQRWGYPHPRATYRVLPPPEAPVAPQVATYRPEWDPGFVIPYGRIDRERIDLERRRRMWGMHYLARQARVGKNAIHEATIGPFPASLRSGREGLRVEVLQRIAKALDLELTDIVRPE